MHHLRFSVLFLIGFSACASSSSSSAPTNGNGVDDVKKACEIRTSWTKRNANTCVECQSFAPIAKCNCPSFANATYMGQCQAQGETKSHEAECDTQLDDCVHTCQDDCGCIDGCYAGKDKCRAAAAAVDGCVAEVCASYCQ